MAQCIQHTAFQRVMYDLCVCMHAGARSACNAAARSAIRHPTLLSSICHPGSSRPVFTCHAASASEVGPKKPKRPAGKQQQQADKHERHQSDRHAHSSSSSRELVDFDEEDSDDEDEANFLVST